MNIAKMLKPARKQGCSPQNIKFLNWFFSIALLSYFNKNKQKKQKTWLSEVPQIPS